MKPSSKSIFIRAGYVLLTAVVTLFLLRFFFIDVYRIPSESMMNKLMTDDYILINKLAYSSCFSRFITASPQQGDILVFTINKDIPGFFVKRCIGLPGATVAIKNGEVNVDGKPLSEPISVRHYYKIWFNDYQQVKTAIEQIGMDKFKNGFRHFPRYILLALDNFQKNKMNRGVDSMKIWNHKNDPDSGKINLPELSENILDMSALKIPFKGMTIYFNQSQDTVYSNTIRMYEDSSFRLKGNVASIAGKQVSVYTFTKDYFFMMGDNRDIAIDSRHYGFIPRDNLVGKFIQQF